MPMILLVEDELTMVAALRDAFQHHGFSVKTATDGETGIHVALREQPDLVILDVMLPDLEGFEVCRRLREQGFSAPIVMLTARSEEVDRIVGLEIGADDYVTKPFSMRELIARVKAHLRRVSRDTAAPSQCSFGDVRVDFRKLTLLRDGRSVPMTSTEWSILQCLAEHRNEIVTREQILNHVWGYETYPDSRTVDTHILNLRHKLEADPRNPRLILTVHGLGYKFIEE